MRRIDLHNWPRRKHYQLYKDWTYPHFGMTANLDLTVFLPEFRERGVSFSIAMAYVIARTANRMPAFRYRIRGELVVEHAVVHPSPTVLDDDDLFGFCTIPFSEAFAPFAEDAERRMAHARAHPTLEDGENEDDVLYMTSIPWVAFTSFMHPVDLKPVDSIPRFAWGRHFDEGGRVKMPLNVQAHHGLMDGIHIARFFESLQEDLDQPDRLLSGKNPV